MSLISGNAIFNSGSVNCSANPNVIVGASNFCSNAQNCGLISSGYFFDSSSNIGTISCNATFAGTTINSGSVVLAEFCGSASNLGVVLDSALFSDTASNVGSVVSATFTDTASNVGIVSGIAEFNGNSSNVGVVEVATFSETAINNGSVSIATFSGDAVNLGIINESASFFGDASNSGVVETAVFNDNAVNLGVISGSGLFFGTAINSGVISGNAIFADTTINNGSVEGSANFSLTASNEGGTVIGETGVYVKNGGFSNAYYLNNVINTDYNSSNPIQAIDNNVWYMYSNGLSTIATGAYSSAYFDNGSISVIYNLYIPRLVQDNSLYYTFLSGRASIANGAYSVGYYTNGEIEGGYNSAIPIDTIDSNYYIFSSGTPIIATGAYSNGYYSTGIIDTTFSTSTPTQAQDNGLCYTYASGVATIVSNTNWYDDSSSYNRNIVNNGSTLYTEAGGIQAAQLSNGLTIDTNTNGNFGNGDFTVEFFYKPDQLAGFPIGNLWPSAGGNSWAIGFPPDGGFYLTSATAGYGGGGVGTMNANVWNYVALVRNNGVVSAYVDGNRVNIFNSAPSFTENSDIILNTADYVYPTYGKIAMVRVSDIARYSGSSHTIPTSVFTNDNNTLLLLKFGATNVPSLAYGY